MCGACGQVYEPDAVAIGGIHGRERIAARAQSVLRGAKVSAFQTGWIVREPTGSSEVVRTFDQLAHIVARRTRVPHEQARNHLLGAQGASPT